MNRKVIVRGAMVALMLIMMVSMVASASPNAASTTKQLSTNFTLVNLGTTPANVTVAYVNTQGGTWKPSDTYPIPANFGQQIVTQYTDPNLPPGRGSVVVSSDSPLGAVVQELARNQVPTSGAYTGIDTPADVFYVPQVLKNRPTQSGTGNTQIAIQNAGAAAIATLKVDFIPSPGSGFAPFTKSPIAIATNATYLYDIADEAGLPNGWVGSAVVTSETGKNIAVVINLFNGANSLQSLNGFTPAMVGTGWSIPLFTSRLSNGLSTPIVVQNLSGGELAANAITVNCASTISSPATLQLKNTAAVVNNASYAFNPVTDQSIAANWTGSCSLTSTGNVVVFVQMRKPGVTDDFAAWEALRSNTTNTRVVVPLMSKRQSNGFATVATIQNLSTSAAATVTLTYTPAAAYPGSQTPITFDGTIPAGGNLIQNLRFGDVSQLPDGWYGTLLVAPKTGTTAQPIVGFVQLTNYTNPAGDTFMAHDAFSLP